MLPAVPAQAVMVSALSSQPQAAEVASAMKGPVGVWVVWLAALSVAGGRVVVGWWSGWRLPRRRDGLLLVRLVSADEQVVALVAEGDVNEPGLLGHPPMVGLVVVADSPRGDWVARRPPWPWVGDHDPPTRT